MEKLLQNYISDENVIVFSGSEEKAVEGIKYFDNMMLEKMGPDECYCVCGVPKLGNEELANFHREWNKKRKFRLKIIYQNSFEKEAKMRAQLPNTEVRITDLPFGAWFNIAGDYITLKTLRPEPMCLVVKNAEARKSFEQFFKFMWDSARKVT
ncbi:MAG: hypothetical protein Q8K92_02020 [Leadbetterella sp.]|nr:hypothetical protein [Leadbetterella sp.]